MSKGFDGSVPPLSARPQDSVGVTSLQNYKKILCHILKKEGQVSNKSEWVKKVAQNDLYNARGVARFLLFCACHDSIPDPSSPGLLKTGKPKSNEMLTSSIWNDGDYFTVEHIAPQSNNGKWDNDLYDDARTIHRLGNLLLLPSLENTIVGNSGWDIKRELFSAFCAKDKDQVAKIIASLQKKGINLSVKAQEVLDKGNHLKMCESVVQLPTGDSVWTSGLIDKRSTRLAELAWDRIYPWLS
jgi:hypothetical protein